MENILSTLLNVRARYIAYRVVIATKSTLGETKRTFNTRRKEHINYIKHYHPEKSAKHTLDLDHRMNWSKTQIVAFENDFRKRRFIESFFVNSTPNVIYEKSSNLFP